MNTTAIVLAGIGGIAVVVVLSTAGSFYSLEHFSRPATKEVAPTPAIAPSSVTLPRPPQRGQPTLRQEAVELSLRQTDQRLHKGRKVLRDILIQFKDCIQNKRTSCQKRAFA